LEGGKGDIFHTLNKQESKFYNIKCIKKLAVSEKNVVEKLVNEKNMMMKAKMSSFLSFTHKVFHDESHIFFVMKHYPHGNL
jgi:serine/threonine protein kinase